MPLDLTGRKPGAPDNTYQGLLHLNTPLSGTPQAVVDGLGTSSPLQLSTTSVDLTVPLPIGSGGTGAATAVANVVFCGPTSGGAAAPSFRALVTGDLPLSGIAAYVIAAAASVFQPLDGDLTAIAALSGTGFAKRTGANTWSVGGLVAGDIPDVSATYVTIAGTQTVSGAKTFSGGIKVSDLTAGRVVLVGTGGLLEDDAMFLFTAGVSPQLQVGSAGATAPSLRVRNDTRSWTLTTSGQNLALNDGDADRVVVQGTLLGGPATFTLGANAATFGGTTVPFDLHLGGTGGAKITADSGSLVVRTLTAGNQITFNTGEDVPAFAFIGSSIQVLGTTTVTDGSVIAAISGIFVDATHATRTTRLDYRLYDAASGGSGGRLVMRLEADGAHGLAAFGGTVSTAKVTVTPDDDMPSLELRRFGSSQTAPVLRVTTEDGATELLTIDKDGNGFVDGVGFLVGNAVVGPLVDVTLVMPHNGLIEAVQAHAETGPTGDDLIIDLKKNGTSIWNSTPANRLTIADGDADGDQDAFDTADFVRWDKFTLAIANVGSITPGAKIIVTMAVRYKNVSA